MQSAVFECSICFNYYNNSQHKPLMLPCGHVYCLECLQRMFAQGNNFCPADKIQHNVSLSQLPCCYAILNHLPSTASKPVIKAGIKPLHCKRHPNKMVKFVCEEHKDYLCTYCVLDHSGAGHRISPIVVDYKAAKEKALNLKAKVQAVVKMLNKYKEKLDKKAGSLEEHYSKQKVKLEYEYNKSLKLAAQKQQELLKAFSDGKRMLGSSAADSISMNNKKLTKLGKLLDQLKGCLNSMSSINEFEDFMESADTILSGISSTSQPAENHRTPLKVILINDKSEIRPIVKRSRGDHTNLQQYGRAHSTAREHRKHSKKHNKKRDAKAGDISHRIDENFNFAVTGVQKIYRHETLSPEKDDRGSGIMSPSSLETTAVNTTKAAHAIENILASQRYHDTPIDSHTGVIDT